MKINELLDPILDQGIRHTNFFEGRLLTGDDLRNQHEANREHDRRLGKAVGPGIIEGLEVELLHDGSDGESPTVRVTKGLAINREGEIIGLPHNDITLALTEPREPRKWDPADFYICAGPPGVQHLPSGAGVYVLVMSPVAGYKERAPKSGLGDNGIAKGCGSKYIQEGVEFRLVELTKSFLLEKTSGTSSQVHDLLDMTLLNDIDPLTSSDLNELSKLRNILSHICLGTESTNLVLSDAITDSYSSYWFQGNDFVRQLYDSILQKDCDVVLALIFWTLEGVAFVDMWSTRRLLVKHWLKTHDFDVNNLFAIWQFQKQIDDVPDISEIRLTENYHFIPPIFRVPVKEPKYDSSTGADLKKLLGLKYNKIPDLINASALPALLNQSFRYPSRPISNFESLRVIYVKENIFSVLEGESNQLYAYIMHVEIDNQFCHQFLFFEEDIKISSSEFKSLLAGATVAYQEFKRISLLFGMASGSDVSREDMLGLQSIDNVLSVLSSLLHELERECFSNHALYRNFLHLAETQKYFIRIWEELVLQDPNGDKYRPEIHQVISIVGDLINEESTAGFRGLILALTDMDIVSAYLTQQKIVQSFTVNLGTGAIGIIGLEYVYPPVGPLEEIGSPPVAPESSPLLSAGEYIFGFELDASINAQSRFQLIPRIEQFGWEAVIVDADNIEQIPPYYLTLEKSDHLPEPEIHVLKIKVKVPETGEANASLIFVVEENPSGGGVPPAQDIVNLTRGAVIPTPDDRLTLKFNSYGTATPHKAGILISRSDPSSVSFLVRSQIQGQFLASVVVADGSPWVGLQLLGDSPLPPTDSLDLDLLSDPPISTVFTLNMLPGDGAGGDTDLIISLGSKADSEPVVEPSFEEIYRLPVYIQD